MQTCGVRSFARKTGCKIRTFPVNIQKKVFLFGEFGYLCRKKYIVVMKKGLIFTIIAYVGVWLLIGGAWLCGAAIASPLWVVVAVLCMLVPLIATIISQLIHKEVVLRNIGIRWKFNRWWIVAWLLPVLMAAAIVSVACLMPGVHFTMESAVMTDALTQINSMLPEGAALSPAIFLLIQLANGFIAGATVNALFAFGEEVGWRGYLLKQFAGKKFLFAAVVIGAIWGLWHAPLILCGLNFPSHPVAGVFMMVVACVCLAPVVQFVRLKSGSVVAAAIFHGSFNAFATFVVLFLDHNDELLTAPMGLAGIIVFLMTLGALHLTDRSLLPSTIKE